MIVQFILTFVVLILGSTAAHQKSPESEKRLMQAADLLRAGEIRRAEALFRELLQSATKQQDDHEAARSRIGLAACYLITHDYREAVKNGESALRYGLNTNDADIAVRAALNLSNVYRRMGDFAAASQTMRNLNPILPQITDPKLKTQLYLHAAINIANNAAQDADWLHAESLFFAAIDTALATGETQTAATAWSQLGYMRLQRKDFAKAESALVESFRLRRLGGSRNLIVSCTYLGMLRLAQGDGRSALNLLNTAVDMASAKDTSLPIHTLYYWRAKAKTAISDTRGALEDFELAVNSATRWRHDVLPADGFRITAEIRLNNIFDEYVQAGMGSWATTKNPALAQRMFEVSEQHRSASFRELLRSGKQLPAEYWEALANYRSVLASSLTSDDPAAKERARLNLVRIESSLGLEVEGEGSARVGDIQRRLGPGEALISFHTGQEKSYAWAITHDTFEARTIAGLRELAPHAKRHREAIETGGPTHDATTHDATARLYEMLFGAFSPLLSSKRDWMLSLDQGLYDIPYAALGPPKTPLILSHSLRTIPGAALLSRPGRLVRSAHFVGAGDAIYNSADPRWSGSRKSQTNHFARLINTRQEVLAVAQAWKADHQPTLLFGPSFNRASLDQAFLNEPAVVHIAAHVVRGASDASNVMIGIGLADGGKAEFLTPSDIAARRARVGLVSINGCASGGGAALPGAGLVGLTRSWLLGGATAVAATYWPVNDDRGELFSKMYGELGRFPDTTITASKAAQALQSAQIEALRSGGPRSKPSYWAAVFLASKQ